MRIILHNIVIVLIFLFCVSCNQSQKQFTEEHTRFTEETTSVAVISSTATTVAPLSVQKPITTEIANSVNSQNTIPSNTTDVEILSAYYTPSKTISYGYLTRYLSKDRAFSVAEWQVGHFLEQANRGELLLGGGYSPERMKDGDWTAGKPRYIFPPDTLNDKKLTPAQRRLYKLTELIGEDNGSGDLLAVLMTKYDYIVAMKSPNDIGRVFCVYDTHDEIQLRLVARVLVMDTSAVNHYTGIGNNIGIPLGYRVTKDQFGVSSHWLADVPDELFYQLKIKDNSWAVFVEDVDDSGCDSMLGVETWQHK